MGSLIWVLNLWGLRLAAGAAVLAGMGVTVAMYQQAIAATDRVVAAGEVQRSDLDEVWETL